MLKGGLRNASTLDQLSLACILCKTPLNSSLQIHSLPPIAISGEMLGSVRQECDNIDAGLMHCHDTINTMTLMPQIVTSDMFNMQSSTKQLVNLSAIRPFWEQ